MNKQNKLTRGRPATGRKQYDTTRHFGRVSDADWQAIKEACDNAKQSLVEWALPVLLKKAKREKLLTTRAQ